MAFYRWRGINPHGVIIHGQTTAIHKSEILNILRTAHITPLQIQRQFHLQQTKIKKQLMQVMEQLAWLLQAHIPLNDALINLKLTPHSPRVAALLEQMHEDVQAGKPLATAVEPLCSWLSREYPTFIATGEASGTLPEILSELCRLKRQQDQLQQKIINALRYPSFLILSSVCMLLAMVTFVIPHYLNFLTEMNSPLPALTQSLIQVTVWIKKYGGAGLLVSLLACCILLKVFWHPRYGANLHLLVLRLPWLGQLIRHADLCRWCYLMAVCSKTNLALLERIKLANNTLKNFSLCKKFNYLNAELSAGKSLYTCFRELKLFSLNELQLLSVGENSNTLSQVFSHLALHHEQQLTQQLTLLTVWVEPLLLIVLAGLTAVMITALYLPMIHLGLHL